MGLNPAPAESAEKRYYRTHGSSYASTVTFLRANAPYIKYYKRLAPFVRALNVSGSIHWTELAKCELKPGVRSPNPQMLSNCARAYLSNELAALPTWPVIAVGRTAFNALSLMCPGRAVVGIPHPTGAWGRAFTSLCSKGTFTPSPRTIARIQTLFAGTSAHWLG